MTDTVMMELAKMQTKIRTYENNEKKHIEQLHLRDDEISRLNKELDLLKLKDQMIAKNQSYLEAKVQKDVDQIKENQKIQMKGKNETKATDDRRKK
jgi:predicted  nucleic acid-binding Zn-ribbon protein|tara:strand:+ start:444 stop:731 length:288 start_codon:yes stop_codon:yes gene_type:complete